MNSTVPRFPREPVLIGRVIGPETYDPRAKPGIEVRAPSQKSAPFASAARRFDETDAGLEPSLGPGAYEPNYNAALGAAGLIAVREPAHRSSQFASSLPRFNAIGMGRTAEPTPPPYWDPARDAAKWQTQPSLAAAWGRAGRWGETPGSAYPLRPDHYNVDASTAGSRSAVLSPMLFDYLALQAGLRREDEARRELARGLAGAGRGAKGGAAGAALGAAKPPPVPPAGPPALDFSFQVRAAFPFFPGFPPF